MKKFLLILAMMLPCLGAWAVTQPETGVYVISGGTTTEPRGNLAACVGIENFPALSNITWSAHSGKSVPAIDNGEHWYVLKIANRYVIYNLGNNKYLVKDGNDINFGDTPYLWQILDNGNYNSIYDAVGTYISFACGTKPSASTRNVKFNNSATDGGSLHTFTTVADGATTYAETINTVNANAPEELSCELTDEFGNVYTGTFAGYANEVPSFVGISMSSIKWENKKFYANITFPFPVSNEETTKKLMINGYNSTDQSFKWYVKENTYIKVNENSAPTTETINNYLWAIYPTFNEGQFTYTIKSIATEKFITSTTLTAGHGDNTLGLADTGVAFELVSNRGYAFKVTDKTLYLSINTSKDDKGEQPVGLHGSLHDGTSVGFIPYVIKYTLTDAANNTFTGEYEGWAGHQTEPTFTGAKGYTLSNQVWDANANTLSATIDFKYPVSKVGETPNEILLDLYRSQNKTTAKYLRAVGGRVKVQPAETAAVDVNAHWAIYPSYENGKFNFAIMNIATGKYIYSNAENNSSKLGDASDVILNATGSKFIIAGDGNDFRFADRENLYLSINSDADADVLLGVHRSAHNGTQMSATAVTSYGVKVGETTYATFYAPKAVTIPENVEAFAVTATNDGRATLTKIENTIPANTGVILKATEAGVYNFAVAEEVEEVENLLEGTVIATMVEGPAYVLGNVEGIGLYNAKLTENKFLNNGYKAYLPASAVSTTAQALRFNFGGTTGIEDAVVAPSFDANAPIFDLSGRRVMNTVKGGIYIQNGKKFIVK